MALTTVFAVKNSQHVDRIGPLFRNKQLVMAITAVEPLGVLKMREEHDRLTRRFLEKDVEVEQFYLGLGLDIGARIDGPGTECRNPIHVIT